MSRISADDLNKLESLDVKDVERHLASVYDLNDYDIDLYQACFLDYYVTHYWWAARQMRFNQEQVSVYFTMIYNLMDNLKGINASN